MNSGIYSLFCNGNNVFYIGSATSFRRRWNQHYKALRKGSHINSRLQRAYDKYGRASFIEEILEQCEPNSLKEREQRWLDSVFESGVPVFNTNRSAYRVNSEILSVNGIANTGRRHSDQARTNMSAAHKGLALTDAQRAGLEKAHHKAWETLRGKKGMKATEAQLQNLAIGRSKQKGKSRPDMIERNKRRIWTEESCQKLSESLRKKWASGDFVNRGQR